MDKITLRAGTFRADEDSRVITFRASTNALDRHGTRFDVTGIDTENYSLNPIFGWAHDLYGGFFSSPRLDHVLGRTVAIKKSAQALDIDVDFAPAEVNPTADMAFRMVKNRFLNAVSVGVIPRDVIMETHDGVDVPVIRKSELLEVSLVSIPSNPEALALTRDFEALLQKYKQSTPPDPSADLGVVIDALKSAFQEWQVRQAFTHLLE